MERTKDCAKAEGCETVQYVSTRTEGREEAEV
jgi:hypothetical protein